MKRSLILVPILLAGCSQEPAKPAAAAVEPTKLILQCDGEHVGHGESTRQRRTYRIDLQAKTVDLWASNKWKEREGEDKLNVTDTNINWFYSWMGQEKGKVTGIITQSTNFNRTLGSISSRRTVVIPEGKVEDTFNGQCVKVDEPSTERAF